MTSPYYVFDFITVGTYSCWWWWWCSWWCSSFLCCSSSSVNYFWLSAP